MAEFVDPDVVGIDGGHGCVPPCAPPDGEALVALPVVVALLVVEFVLDPPADPDAVDALGRLAVGTLRGSQPMSITHVGFAELVKKLGAPLFCCGAWVAGVRLDGAAAAAAGFCMV